VAHAAEPHGTDGPHAIDFWFDFSCPYAYLASTQRRWLAEESGAIVRLQPFLLGGVFRALGQAQNLSTTLSPPKARHNRLDVIRWAAWFGVPLNSPLQHPNRTVQALRVLLATPESQREAVVDAFFSAYWVDRQDLSDARLLHQRLTELGLDADVILQHADSPDIRRELHDRTDQALAVGVFGAPAFVANGQLFWGQDRLPMVVRAAQGWQPEHGHEHFTF
jgi:2-hydroxychromene-2-carboxylate isomerase